MENGDGERDGRGTGRGEAGKGKGKGEKGKRERKGTYDLVRNVMPHVRLPLRLPLGVLGDHELKIGVRGALLARDPARLQLDEVRLEEADLVLAIDARRVHVFAHDREVVVYLAAVDSGLGLRDQPVRSGEKGTQMSVLYFIRRAS